MLEQQHLDVVGLGLVALATFFAFVFYLGWAGGRLGGTIADALIYLFGAVAYLTPVVLFGVGAVLVLRPMLPSVRPFKTGTACLLGALLLGLAAGSFGLGPDQPPREGAFADASTFRQHGGTIGELLYLLTRTLVQDLGTHILFAFLLLIGVLLLTGGSVAGVVRATRQGVSSTSKRVRESTSEFAAVVTRREPGSRRRADRRADDRDESGEEPPAYAQPAPPLEEGPEPPPRSGDDWLEDEDLLAPLDAEPIVRATHVEAPPLDAAHRYPDIYGEPEEPQPQPEPDRSAGSGAVAPLRPATARGAAELAIPEPGAPGRPDPGSEGEHELTPMGRRRSPVTEAEQLSYALPPASLLERSRQTRAADRGSERKTGAALVEALGHLGIDARIVATVSGPHITRYELRLSQGTKMSKVSQLRDDIAYALAATDVRILAPIPGKQAVGVEVPATDRRVVTLGDVFQEAPEGWSPLTVWLGKDIAGKAIGTDLAKQPHVLVAGTTGSGKSGCVNAMLASILLRATPNEVRLVLVDPKQVELGLYDSVPHLLTPVVTNPRLAANVLGNLIKEMEQRYEVMSAARTRNLAELNRVRERDGEAPLPHILCVIDELADLMMIAPGEVEDSIIRLAQKSRAVGIHLVLATQRPSADIITGIIKANVPARIAFAVSSQTDSRVILDANGAESLLGKGDMLFRPASESRGARIQGAFVSEEEIERLVEHWSRQGEPELREELLDSTGEGVEDGGSELDADSDDLLAQAIATVAQMGSASTSMLQRRLRVGYTRAGRLIDMMERRGVISGYEGSKARQVLVSEAELPRVLAELEEPVGAGAGGSAAGP